MKTELLCDSLWASVYVTGYKIHYAPRALVAGLVTDLELRQSLEYPSSSDCETIIKEEKDGLLDLPGMCMIDRPMERIIIDTFKVIIPSQHFRFFYDKLNDSNEQTLKDGRKCYKMHGWLSSVVFTRDQRAMVLQEMKEMMPRVDKRVLIADEEFNRRVKELYKERLITIVDKKS